MSPSSSRPPACAIPSISSTPGHHGPAREVAAEERLVDGDVLERDDPLARLDLQHPVDQQERIAVRQHRQDPLDVPLRGLASTHRLAQLVLPVVHDSPSLFSRAREAPAHLFQARQQDRLAPPLAHLDGGDAGHLPSPARPRSGPPTWPPPGRRSPSWMCPATPACPASTTSFPSRVLPAMPAWPQRIQCRPTRTLCPTWTRLSILVPAPIRVSSRVARSMVVLAPISTSVLEHHPADLRHLVVGAAVGGVAEAVGPQHHAGVDDARRPRPRCRRRARREDGAPRPPPPRSRGRWRRRRWTARPRRRSGCRRRSRRRGRRGRRGRPRSRAPGSPWGWTPGSPALGGMEDGEQPGQGVGRIVGDQQVPAEGPRRRGPAPPAGRRRRSPRPGAVAGVFRNERSAGPAASRVRIASTARSGSPSTRPPTSSASSASR